MVSNLDRNVANSNNCRLSAQEKGIIDEEEDGGNSTRMMRVKEVGIMDNNFDDDDDDDVNVVDGDKESLDEK